MRDSDPDPLAQSLYVRDLDPRSTSSVNIIFQNLKNYLKALNKIRLLLKTQEKDFQFIGAWGTLKEKRYKNTDKMGRF